jgi:hypothetical protein
MRIVTWMLMGIGAGVLAGFVSALLRRRHHRVGEPVAEYAGGYVAPVASEDRTASHPSDADVSGSSPISVAAGAEHANGTGHANGAGDASGADQTHQIHRVDKTAPAGRADRAEFVGRGGRG